MSEDRGDELETLEEDTGLEEAVEEEEEVETEESSEEEEASEEDSEEDEVDEEEEEDEPRIPKHRLDEVIAQREAEKERVKTLEETVNKLIEKLDVAFTKEEEEDIEEEVDYDFDLAERKYVELIASEDFETASALRKEIEEFRMAKMQKQIEEARKKAISESKAAVEEEKFNTLRESLEKTHKVFNPESPQYDEDVVDTVNTLMVGYMAKGFTKAVALQKAANKVLKTVEVKAPKARTKTAKKKAIDTLKKQPPKTTGVKTIEKEVDISKLSRSEIKKLSKDELAKLRGDVL